MPIMWENTICRLSSACMESEEANEAFQVEIITEEKGQLENATTMRPAEWEGKKPGKCTITEFQPCPNKWISKSAVRKRCYGQQRKRGQIEMVIFRIETSQILHHHRVCCYSCTHKHHLNHLCCLHHIVHYLARHQPRPHKLLVHHLSIIMHAISLKSTNH